MRWNVCYRISLPAYVKRCLVRFDAYNNTKLKDLNCEDNQIKTLDLSNNTALENLICGDNQLTSLDVSKNTALVYLYCRDNLLTTLDVSNNLELSRLDCSQNQLTSLDVSNISLDYLDCTLNYMASVDDVNGWERVPYFYFYPQRDVPPYITPTVSAYIGAKSQAYVTDKIEYQLALSNAVNVLAVDFEFKVDGAMLVGNSFEGLNGFTMLESVNWTDKVDGTWTGAVKLGYTEGDYGFTEEPYTDIARLVFDSTGLLGEASLTIKKLEITGLDQAIGEVVYYNVIIEAGIGTTIILNKYDLNKDGVVDLIDLGIMLLYVGFNENDPEWATLVKVNDRNGIGITPKDCDVNGDGEIDMADLIELIANFD